MKKLKITFNSPVVLGFIFISLAVLVVGFLTGGKSNELLFMTYHSALTNPLTYVRFFTHVLGHADGSIILVMPHTSCFLGLCWKKSMDLTESC